MATRDQLRSAFFDLSGLIGRVVAVETTHYRDAIELASGTLTGIELAEGSQSIHLLIDGKEHRLSRKPGNILISVGELRGGRLRFREVFSGIEAVEPAVADGSQSEDS